MKAFTVPDEDGNPQRFIEKILLVKIRYRLLFANVIVAVVVGIMFAGILLSSDVGTQKELAYMGTIFLVAFVFILAMYFAILGKQLISSPRSAHVRYSMFFIAACVSILLIIQSVIQIITTTDDSLFSNYLNTTDVIYYSADIVLLGLVLIILQRPVNEFITSQSQGQEPKMKASRYRKK